jgi:hypothetical protein
MQEWRSNYVEGAVVERKTKAMFNGKMVDGMEVPIEESNEKWSEFKFEDGTIIRAKISLLQAVRVDGEYDPAGNPTYAINMAPTIAIIEVPEKLRKKV